MKVLLRRGRSEAGCTSACWFGSSLRMDSEKEASPSGARPLGSSTPLFPVHLAERHHSCLALTGGVGSRDSDFGYGQLLEGHHPWGTDGSMRRGASGGSPTRSWWD